MKISRSALLIGLTIVVVGLGLYARKYFWYPIQNKDAAGDVVLALGDSLTYGTGAGPGEDWPSLVSDMCQCEIINKGVPGETTADAYARLQTDVINLHPRLVIVGLGGNDILRQQSHEEMFTNLRRIVEEIQNSGAMVVILGLNGFPIGGDLADGYSKLARETGSIYVPNIMGGILSNPRLKSDQIHPNAAGYKVMADKIYGKLEPFL